MNGTPMRLVILILGLFGFVALIGAIALQISGQAIPNEIWLVITNAGTGIGALLANPRSGVTQRSGDSNVKHGAGL